MKQFFINLSTIGHLANDDADAKVKKSFLVFLALFMSGGGLLWGTIALLNGLLYQSMIPYGYTVLSAFNLIYFKRSKNFSRVRFVQIFISLMLPFLFQWSLGGFFSSGLIMLWALLALVASPSFQTPKSSIIWLVLFIAFTIVSAVFQDFFYTLKPEILGDQSLLFISLNAGVIGSIVFFLVIYFVQRSNDAQIEIQKANQDLEGQKEELNSQKDVLQSALVETNEIIQTALSTGNFDTRMNVDDKKGEWQDLAKSINKLFDTIVGPLTKVRHIANFMMQGDLTKRFDDEAHGQISMLKNSLNESLDQFSDLLYQIRKGADSVGKSSHEMKVASEEMNLGTIEINSAIKEISHGATNQLSKVDQASALIATLSSSAQDIDSQALFISQKAQEGVKRSDQAIQNVNELTNDVGNNYEFSNTLLLNLEELTKEARSISDFTKLITEIASQTNMLSLNAAIQAADAGEQGKGFGVVSEEIRQLAERARGSVLEIENLISGIQERIAETQQSVVEMNSSIGQSKQTAQKIQEDFSELHQSMTVVVNESNAISEATQRQNGDLDAIVKLIENIVLIAEESAASSNNVAESTTGLASGMSDYTSKNQVLLDIATELHIKTKKFMLDGDKKGSATTE